MDKRLAFRSDTTRRGLVAMVAVMLILMWLLIVLASAEHRERLVDDSTRELAQMNGAVSQQVTATLASAETALHTVDLWISANPKADPRSDPHLAAVVDDIRRASRRLIDVYLVARDGTLFDIPGKRRFAAADVSGREYFRTHAGAGSQRLFIGCLLYTSPSPRD